MATRDMMTRPPVRKGVADMFVVLHSLVSLVVDGEVPNNHQN